MTLITEFEREFCEFTGAKHAIAVCNGTASLHTALLTLGITTGTKVVTTPFSFIASSNAILYCGATPVFADINPKTYCIDPKRVREAIEANSNVKAILCVHLFGKPCELDQLQTIAHINNLRLIEDCAQAFGATYMGKHVGTYGDFGCFSFYTSKNLWTFEGGMLTTNNPMHAQIARQLINHGRDGKHRHVVLGYNYRMPEPCALMGLRMLQRHQKGMLAELGSYGPDEGYYPYVIYDQPLYRRLGIKGNCPNAEKVAKYVRTNC